MSIIGTLVIGFIVGLLARFLKPGDDKMGIILTTVLGVIGALTATYGGQALGLYAPGQPAGFMGAVVGAIVVLVIYSLVAKSAK
ncbi:MAG: GlsB/YeaQ/YmgE family stress response membrane protein [Panacagrimonas sp.]